ncbi:hypothetical protein BJY52DRAFT_1223553 [Lactarius psammicola]|nr:hypothetical protein BJY52DRAFT_1223553 [Lactarius psammicola]
MSPHHLFWHGHRGFYNPMFCGPSRFLWFSFGSLVTFAWMHHRRDAAQIGYDDRSRGGGGRGPGQWGREAGPQGRSARFDEQQQQQQWGSRRGTEVPPDYDSRFDANGGQREPSTPPLPPPVAAEASAGRFPVDRELDRLREMSRNAEETISGMSEGTIDSMMGALQRLKDRLAERRGQQLEDSRKPLAPTTPLATSPEEPPRPRHWV